MKSNLTTYIEATSTQPVHAIISEFAQNIRAKHGNVQAIIAYGSALREATPENTLIDFYVLTETEHGISNNLVSRYFCKVLPPNVYYAEFTHAGKTYRAKYAALTLNMLAKKVQPNNSNPYFWARFAQPMRLVWSHGESAKAATLAIFTTAISTAKAHAAALVPNGTPREQWSSLFQHTYPTELRPELAGRATQIVDAYLSHYESITDLAVVVQPSTVDWSTRRWQGKLLSVVRLLKAAFTFQGGADYAAWKIKRHSGVDIEVKPWHRSHPVIASIVLLPKLLKRGALK